MARISKNMLKSGNIVARISKNMLKSGNSVARISRICLKVEILWQEFQEYA